MKSDKIIAFRCETDLAQAMERAAAGAGMKLSAWLRATLEASLLFDQQLLNNARNAQKED